MPKVECSVDKKKMMTRVLSCALIPFWLGSAMIGSTGCR